jgi:hypothetical protein
LWAGLPLKSTKLKGNVKAKRYITSVIKKCGIFVIQKIYTTYNNMPLDITGFFYSIHHLLFHKHTVSETGFVSILR